MASENPKGDGRVDVGEWKQISTSKNSPGIPPLGSNAYSCPCSNCKAILKESVHWTSMEKEGFSSDIKIGDRVLVHGTLPGVVRYVGDLDSDYIKDQIYVGVKLDDPVGEHDGLYQNKRFFKCPDMHGVIVPIEAVHLLVPTNGHLAGTTCKFYSMPALAEIKKSTSAIGSPKAMSAVPVTSDCCTPAFRKSVSAKLLKEGCTGVRHAASASSSIKSLRDNITTTTNPGAESYTKCVSSSKVGGTATAVSNSATSVKRAEKSATSIKRAEKSATSVKRAEKSATSIKRAEKSATSVKRAEKSATSIKPTEKSATSIKRAEKSATSIKRAEKSATSIKRAEKSATSIKRAEKSASSVKPAEKSATSIKPTEKSATSIKPAEKSAASIKPAEKSTTSVKRAEKSATSIKSASEKESAVASVPPSEKAVQSHSCFKTSSGITKPGSSVRIAESAKSLSARFQMSTGAVQSTRNAKSTSSLRSSSRSKEMGQRRRSLSTQTVNLGRSAHSVKSGKSTNNKKNDATSQTEEKGTADVQSPTVTSTVQETGQSKTSKPPEVPDLPLVPIESSGGRDVIPMSSFTNRLLSNLPMEGTFTPPSSESQLEEVREFAVWVQVWGGGVKAWSMAQTLQKLKDGERKGQKEVEWQKTIDVLEQDDAYACPIQRIRALRNQIEKVRVARERTERRTKQRMFSNTEVQLVIEQLKEEIKVQLQQQQELREQLRSHPLGNQLETIKAQLGITEC